MKAIVEDEMTLTLYDSKKKNEIPFTYEVSNTRFNNNDEV